jgi:hypothetical protein
MIPRSCIEEVPRLVEEGKFDAIDLRLFEGDIRRQIARCHYIPLAVFDYREIKYRETERSEEIALIITSEEIQDYPNELETELREPGIIPDATRHKLTVGDKTELEAVLKSLVEHGLTLGGKKTKKNKNKTKKNKNKTKKNKKSYKKNKKSYKKNKKSYKK